MCSRALGDWGERIAERHLRQRGYRIIGRQWNCRYGELDLIAMDGDEVVFVEVKTRRFRGFGSPAAAVDARKRQRLRRAAWDYLSSRHMEGSGYRIDVVSVERITEDRYRLAHIRSAVGEED